MQWIYIICFALISAGLLALFGVRPGDFIDALFRSQRKAAITRTGRLRFAACWSSFRGKS